MSTNDDLVEAWQTSCDCECEHCIRLANGYQHGPSMEDELKAIWLAIDDLKSPIVRQRLQHDTRSS